MSIDRRSFLRTSIGSAAIAAVASCTGNAKGNRIKNNTKSEESKACLKDAKLNISFQEWTIEGKTLNDKLNFMEQHEVKGLEVSGKNLSGRVDEFQQALSGRDIKISAICAGFKGFMLSEEESIRNECRDSMREIIAAAGKLESTGVIIVPAFNAQKPVMPHTMETRDFLCQWFDEIGTFARENGTTVILEPLNRKEAFYLRILADAASICRDIGNPGVTCLGDFWHMTWEETSDMGAFLSAGKYLQHVHIASRKRRLIPGEDGDADNYTDGFRGLKMIGYDKYISLECGSKADDRNASAAAAAQLIREQWENA